MASLRLKLRGLSDSDKTSLQSMLRLSADLLSVDWEIVDQGDAHLEIFSFDSDSGQQAWHQRSNAVTALLTNSGNVTEPVDIVLRKPLRKSNFAEALNLVEEKIRLQQSAQEQSADQQSDNKDQKGLWGGKLLDKLRRKPDASLPALDFLLSRPEPVSKNTDTIKDPALLQSWVNQLPRDARQKTATLLKNIQPLCAMKLKPALLLQLLEVYRTAIHDLLFSRDISAVKRDLTASPENLRAIRGVSELFAKLSAGYQQVAAYYYRRGETPDINQTLHLSLNRSAEQLALMILHAYQYYRKAPETAWQQLHQMYLYQEKAGTAQLTISNKDQQLSRSLFDLYTQIVLTALADPYSLARFDVFRLFRLMEQFTDKVEINLLSDKQINTTSGFMLTGHFCIDGDNDQPPQPMVKTDTDIRQKTTTRLLNTQPALLYVENLFKDARTRTHASLDTELRLLKRIIPHLNTTHERRYHRITSGKNRQVQIAHGINAIHQSLGGTLTHALPWQLANQSSGGLMAKRDSEGCYHLNIGDFIGIFEQDFSVKLATIKWLYIDIDDQTHIGVELISGKPVPVYCTPDGEAEQHPALILPADTPDDASAMITEKGLYSPRRRLRVKDDGEPYLIKASGMIDSTLDYELFSFTPLPTGS